MRRRKGASGCGISYQLHSKAEGTWFHSSVSDLNNYFVLLTTLTKPVSCLMLCQTAHHTLTSLLQHSRVTELSAEQHKPISQNRELQNFFTYQGMAQFSHNFSFKSRFLAKMKVSAESSNTGRLTKEHAAFFPNFPSWSIFEAKFLSCWDQSKDIHYRTGSAAALFWRLIEFPKRCSRI